MDWLIENPNLRKHLKESVGVVASMAIKQFILMREKQIKKKRMKLVEIFNLLNR